MKIRPFFFLIAFLLHYCGAAEMNCSRPSVIRRYSYGKNGLVDATGGPNATQMNPVALVDIDATGAHFTNDSFFNPDGGNRGAGLNLGEVDVVQGGRTIHVELTMDTDPFPTDNQNAFWYFAGTADDTPNLGLLRASSTLSPRPNGTVLVYMTEILTPSAGVSLKVGIPNEQFHWRMLLSFSLIVTKLAAPDKYDLDMAIYLNGTRVGAMETLDVEYHPAGGSMFNGRWLACVDDNCNPFFGTMHSMAVDTEPLDNTVTTYDEWESCTAAAVPDPPPITTMSVTESTSSTEGSEATTTTTMTTTTTTTTTAALVFTGGDLDGGGAVGVDEEESSGNQGSALPLTLIVVLAVAAVGCALSLGALLVWRARRRRTMALATNAKPSPTLSSSGEQALSRSRSSKRRRGDRTYAAITVADPATEGAEYSVMPSAGSEGTTEAGYRTLPSDDRGEYRTMPAGADYGGMPAGRTHGYGQVGGTASHGTYTELQRTKSPSSPGADYAAGELELSEL
jgi:hypothetical protein